MRDTTHIQHGESPGKSEVIRLCITYAIAVTIFNIAPIFIGVLIHGHALTELQAGLVATVDMIVMAITGFALGPRLAGTSRRNILLSGAGLVILGNLLSLIAGDFAILAMVRVLSGIGAGLLFIYANTRIGIASNPVRIYGFVTIAATVFGASMLFGLPGSIASYGLAGFYGVVAVLAGLAAIWYLSESSAPLGAGETGALDDAFSLPRPQLVTIAFGMVIIAAVQSAYYGFAEQAGVNLGIDREDVGGMLALGYIGGIATSALATWLSTRIGRWLPLAFGIGLQAVLASVVFLTKDPETLKYCIIGQGLALFFGIPYLLGLAAEADDSGVFANIGVGLFFFGLAIGPFLGGAVIEASGYSGVAWLIAIGTIVGLVALVSPARALGQRD